MKIFVEIDTETPQGRRWLELMLGQSMAAAPQQPAVKFSVQQPGSVPQQQQPQGGPAWPTVQAPPQAAAAAPNGLPDFLRQQQPAAAPPPQQQPPAAAPPPPEQATEERITPGPSPTDDHSRLQNELNEAFAQFYLKDTEKARKLGAELRSEYGLDSKTWDKKQLETALTKIQAEMTF